jgi:hypothetical protein
VNNKPIQANLINAGAASLDGAPIDLTGTNRNWGIEVVLTPSAATLVGVLTFKFGVSDPAGMVAGLSSIQLASATPAGWTIDAAAGTITFASPAATTTRALFVAAMPVKLLQASWVYTSGGGTVNLRAVAWGSVS